jgi:hypothetical protein
VFLGAFLTLSSMPLDTTSRFLLIFFFTRDELIYVVRSELNLRGDVRRFVASDEENNYEKFWRDIEKRTTLKIRSKTPIPVTGIPSLLGCVIAECHVG